MQDGWFASTLLALVAAVAIVLILFLVRRPGTMRSATGKILAFVAFLVLPAVFTTIGTRKHLDYATSTQFCISCHEMGRYGDSLLRDDLDYIPAAHYQNNWIPRGKECYACHTSYTMFGGIGAKLRGLKHVYVHYLGSIPDEIELYEPYQNRECLHCHEQARSFQESEDHIALMEDLISEEISCLDCHDSMHEVESIEGAELWKHE